jgi:hypothetical protein
MWVNTIIGVATRSHKRALVVSGLERIKKMNIPHPIVAASSQRKGFLAGERVGCNNATIKRPVAATATNRGGTR